jgi:twitching motility protein PilT
MSIRDILKDVVSKKVSDVFMVSGRPISYKSGNQIEQVNDDLVLPAKALEYLTEIYSLAGNRDISQLMAKGDDDFSFALPEVARFRVNSYKQRGSLAAVIRVVPFYLPDPVTSRIPEQILELSNKRHGLLLFTGPAGSGKTTTLACLIDKINSTSQGHIITLENPIEYLHRHKMSLVSQREIAIDTEDYASALRAALRQSPNVILIGELRDAMTISIALTAAETGHLIITTLHTVGASNSIDRLVDSFPAGQQNQVRMQLSMVLQSVVSQQLVSAKDGALVPAFQIMHCNNAIRNMIREGRTHQINSVINSSAAEGMIDMDVYLLKLVNEGLITAQEAIQRSISPDTMAKQLK